MNPVRLSRFAGIDFVTSKERLIFTKRRFPWWKVRRIVLPLIAGALGFWFVTRPAPVIETVEPQEAKGVTKDGAAYEMRHDSGAVREFVVKFRERG